MIVIGGDILLFLLTYIALHSREGIFYEIYSQRKHPYRFTQWAVVGQSASFMLVYLIQRYLTPSPPETMGIVLFALFLPISFITVVYGTRMWNLEKSIRNMKRGTEDQGSIDFVPNRESFTLWAL